MQQTKFIYYIDNEEIPYAVRINKHPEHVTLLDLKNIVNKPGFKFFFKAIDDYFGEIKEEIADDHALLPSSNGRIVSWLIPTLVDQNIKSISSPEIEDIEIPYESPIKDSNAAIQPETCITTNRDIGNIEFPSFFKTVPSSDHEGHIEGYVFSKAQCLKILNLVENHIAHSLIVSSVRHNKFPTSLKNLRKGLEGSDIDGLSYTSKYEIRICQKGYSVSNRKKRKKLIEGEGNLEIDTKARRRYQSQKTGCPAKVYITTYNILEINTSAVTRRFLQSLKKDIIENPNKFSFTNIIKMSIPPNYEHNHPIGVAAIKKARSNVKEKPVLTDDGCIILPAESLDDTKPNIKEASVFTGDGCILQTESLEDTKPNIKETSVFTGDGCIILPTESFENSM